MPLSNLLSFCTCFFAQSVKSFDLQTRLSEFSSNFSIDLTFLKAVFTELSLGKKFEKLFSFLYWKCYLGFLLILLGSGKFGFGLKQTPLEQNSKKEEDQLF